jgi:hypothetical protein
MSAELPQPPQRVRACVRACVCACAQKRALLWNARADLKANRTDRQYVHMCVSARACVCHVRVCHTHLVLPKEKPIKKARGDLARDERSWGNLHIATSQNSLERRMASKVRGPRNLRKCSAHTHTRPHMHAPARTP